MEGSYDKKKLTDWMTTLDGNEHFLKVRAANGQHNFMRL